MEKGKRHQADVNWEYLLSAPKFEHVEEYRAYRNHLNRLLKGARDLKATYNSETTLEEAEKHIIRRQFELAKSLCIRRQADGWKIQLKLNGTNIRGKMTAWMEEEIHWATPSGNTVFVSNENIIGYDELPGVFTIKARW